MNNPLWRALSEIDERRQFYSAEVVVRRYFGDEKCGMRCWGKTARFEVRGEGRLRVCSDHIDDALDYLLEPERLDDDMALHVGRHSSVVLRSECTAKRYRPEGLLPEPIGRECYACADARGKKKRCFECRKRYTSSRCICLEAVCATCAREHELRDAPQATRTIWNARGLVFSSHHSKIHKWVWRGAP